MEWSKGEWGMWMERLEAGSDQKAYSTLPRVLFDPLVKRRECELMMKISRCWRCPTSCAANPISPPIPFLEFSNLWSEFTAEGFPFAFERNIIYHQETALKPFGLLQGS